MTNLNLKHTLLLFTCLFVFASAKAQTKYLSNPEEVRALTKKSALLLKENKVSDFFKEIKPFWPMPENELNEIEEKTTQGFNSLPPRFGAVEDLVKIKDETIRDFAIRETYYIKRQNSIIRLVFTYYKNSKGWLVNGFIWDGNFSGEFK